MPAPSSDGLALTDRRAWARPEPAAYPIRNSRGRLNGAGRPGLHHVIGATASPCDLMRTDGIPVRPIGSTAGRFVVGLGAP